MLFNVIELQTHSFNIYVLLLFQLTFLFRLRKLSKTPEQVDRGREAYVKYICKLRLCQCFKDRLLSQLPHLKIIEVVSKISSRKWLSIPIINLQ